MDYLQLTIYNELKNRIMSSNQITLTVPRVLNVHHKQQAHDV